MCVQYYSMTCYCYVFFLQKVYYEFKDDEMNHVVYYGRGCIDECEKNIEIVKDKHIGDDDWIAECCDDKDFCNASNKLKVDLS